MSIVNLVANVLGMSEEQINKFSSSSPHRYKKYDIPKRSGGTRQIAQPSKELKFIQRLVLSELEKKVALHDSAYAYRLGLGIKDNAKVHMKNSYLLKLDFKDFFPSITPSLFFGQCSKNNINFLEEEIIFLSNILFFKQHKKEV